MKSFLYTLAALGAVVAVLAFVISQNATNEVFSAVVGLGAIISLIGGAIVPAKAKKTEYTPSSSIRYDPANIPTPKRKGPPSAVRYDP